MPGCLGWGQGEKAVIQVMALVARTVLFPFVPSLSLPWFGELHAKSPACEGSSFPGAQKQGRSRFFFFAGRTSSQRLPNFILFRAL